MTPRGTLVILGANGFLGPHVVAAASRCRAFGAVIAASRAPASAPVLPGTRAGVSTRAVDALAGDAVERFLAEVAPSAVVLCAALSRVADCARYPGLAEALNTLLPERVARATAALGARLVHVSTDLVFGGAPPRGARYAEDDAPSPVHVYGRTKAAGEERVRAADPRAACVRLPLLFGDSAGRGLGASDALLAALSRGERPALFRDEWRTPLDAANAAEALLELSQGESTGTLHVAGPERLSRLALGLAILEARGLSRAEAEARVAACERASLGLAAERPADTSLDASRARALLATPLLAPREALGARGAP